jgi:RNA-splicing ligase RtcB
MIGMVVEHQYTWKEDLDRLYVRANIGWHQYYPLIEKYNERNNQQYGTQHDDNYNQVVKVQL